MKVGIVCPYNYFRPGGVQECIRELAVGLETRGHEVRVITSRPKIVPENIDENVIMIGSSTELNTPFATKADVGMEVSNTRIDELFETEKFDILHVHEPGVPFLGAQLLRHSPTTNVVTMHASLPDNMISKSFQKMMTPYAKIIAPRAHAATTVSPVSLATTLSYIPDAEIEIIPNGINIANYKPKSRRSTSGDKKTIVYIGRLEKRKGVSFLLDAYAKLRETKNDVSLIIAGDGKLRTGLEARVAKLQIPDVSFVGFVSEEEKVRLLQTADVYCSPALYGESFGIVLLEALSAECVVVCGDNPGYRSVMVDQGKQSLVDPKDTDVFAERLQTMLYDKDARAQWLKWAKKYILQFDYPHVIDQYLEVYHRAQENHKKSQS